MNYKALLLMLILVVPAFSADELILSGDPSSIPGSSTFQSAQLVQEMRTMKTEIITEVNAYNDENFQVFDARMEQFLLDTKTKVALGAIGAGFIVNALVAYLIMRSMKRYSFEMYQEKMIGKLNETIKDKDSVIAGLQQMQQAEWNPQQPTDTMGMVYGQAQASEMSQMNAWQAQSVYPGSWQSPTHVTPEYSHLPPKANIDDPMQSPQWGRQDGQQQ